ncbi:sugar phosphate isomerase/epimerase family protein [Planctomicrobium piriforme]|uniref:Sugar phosphate isomerase/epimerase n=1 Tax=Planctomicrobium piriforme TaxID=1576369 RepID=A0A1I3MQK0_9PLAN|nr:sugar phosphate isomerase/epimerase [Planctomicrobium piriforme]SFI98995.1 Sugar phosphate isomerase/epimerase [Planctomicrobium piriforme]
MTTLNRRQLLAASTAAGLTLASVAPARAAADPTKLRFCLNTSTIRGQGLPIEEEVALVSAAGYDGIEPWMRELEAYREAGKSIPDLKKKIADSGLRVESAIGFATWIVDDEAQRKAGIEQLRHDMDLLQQIGGVRIAAPPIGMQKPDATKVDLLAAAERYAAALKVGREFGVTPQVEVWGFSRNLSRLGEAVFVALESGEPDACILPDVYHIYKGGSSFEGLHMLSGVSIPCFHFNDYPAQPGRAEINDSYRVYPGDGVAPWPLIISTLKKIGFNGVVSLELFNKEYWAQDPKLVLETGLKKLKAVFAS